MRTPIDLDTLIETHGLERHRELLINSLIPAVRLESGRPSRQPLTIGSSKFGGHPDLPSPEMRPRNNGEPMHLLMQLRLSDVPQQHLTDSGLPERGILWAWIDTLQYNWDRISRKSSYTDAEIGHLRASTYRLTFEPDESRPLVRDEFPGFSVELPEGLEDVEQPYREVPLTPVACVGLSDSAMAQLYADDNLHFISDFTGELSGETHGANHQLLGHLFSTDDNIIQAQAREVNADPWNLEDSHSAEFEARASEWQFLLRLDSDNDHLDWMWSDAGSLMWYIRKVDLAARRFDRAVGLMGDIG